MKRNTMNRNIALIIAAAVTVGQIPVSALANDNNTAIVQEAAVENVEALAENYEYNQEYDNYSSTSFTTLVGGGTHVKNMDNEVPGTEGKTGYLEIKRDSSANNKFIFLENQTKSIKDFEAEVRFQLNPSETDEAIGRFGLVFRGTSADSYGFVGYNNDGKWLIESPTAWKDDITGPTIEAGQWVTMKVKVVRNNLTLTVDGQEIFNDIVSLAGFPTTAGQFGYRTWFDNKTVNVDYLKINEVVTPIEVTGVEELNISTLVNSKPQLPYKVNVTYDDGTTGEEVVIWDYVDPANYAQEGTFSVEGTIKGASETSPKAVANVTVREKVSYSTDFETEATSGDWRALSGGGAVTLVDGTVKVGMNGKSVAADMASPDVMNFIYETEFTTSSNDGRIGLAFRVKDAKNWGAICYDAGNWVWKASTNGSDDWGSFPGVFRLEGNKTYKMKLEVEDSKVTLTIDDQVIGSVTSDKFPKTAGKIGLAGWFGNKTITLDNVFVTEITSDNVSDEKGELHTIESDVMSVRLDSKFPRVEDYTWKDDNSVLVGQEEAFNKISINGKNYAPVVESSFEGNVATYNMAIDEIGVNLTTIVTVEGNKIRMEITNIEETGDFLVKKVSLPKHSFATVRSDNGGAIAAVLSSGAWHDIKDEISTVENLEPSTKAKTYAFVNDNDFAITMNNNTVEYSSRILLTTENQNGYKTTGIGSGAWTYREEIENEVEYFSYEENLWAEAYITKDMNNDSSVDWQDAAIEYRNRVEAPMGGEYIKDSLSYIAFNIGYTQSPFLRTLDTVKKLYNYTDGFGQMVLEKGYQGEGHDDVIPDYGGHIGIRQGGVEDFNTLIEEGAKYNARFGVHINATEYQKDAFEYPEEIVTGETGWNWLDQAYYVNQRADVTSGELFRRLDMLKEDLPDLAWVYVDVYTGNGWNAHQLGEKLNDLDFQVATEFHSPLEEHVTWTHWGADPAYPNEGGTSEILRFVRNSTKDGFLSNPLLKGNKHLLSSGWGNNHAIEGEKGLDTFYNQVLPTKYMQHFDIMKMTDDEVLFNDNLRAVREGADINYYKDGKLVATTPENTIGSTGLGKTNLFLEWNFNEGEDTKIYHWNPFSTNSTWELPDSWSNLSNVHVYELTDLGRVEVGAVSVVDGKVTLDVKQNTPYIITQGEVAQDRITDWGYASQIKDPGFDSQEWNTWTKESKSGNTDHITFVNETLIRRAGNDVVSIADKQGTLSQEISDLESGVTYSVSAWVKNDNNRTVTLSVDCGDVEVTNVTTRQAFARQGEGHKYLNDTFTRMEVEFTVPEGITTAKVALDVAEGNGEVIVDDFRIWAHPGHTNKEGYVFYEDFENVDEGITPFFLAPGRGTSNRSHLAEKDLLGRQYMNWVLDGRFSLKTNQQPGEKGQMLVTDDSTFKLEANKTYELGFLYSLADATPGYTLNIKSRSAGTLLSINLDATNVASGEYTNTKSVVKEFTTGNNDDYYMTIDKNSGYADLILDNIYVSEVDKSIENPVLDKANLSLSVNELAVGEELPSFVMLVNGLMNNGSKADLTDATIEYVIANPEVVDIEDGKLVGLIDGTTTITANVTVAGSTVTSNSVNIIVGEGSSDEEIPPVIEVDKSELQAVVDGTADLVKDNYTVESWKVFEAALAGAQEVLANDDATQEQVNEAKSALESAIEALEEKIVAPPTDIIKNHLEIAVEVALEVTEEELEGVVPAVVTEFKEALAQAQSVLANSESTQAEVNESFERLSQSMQMLEFKKGDKTSLISLIDKINGLNAKDYIVGSWNKLQKVLAVANKVAADSNAMQEEVQETYENLLRAFLELRLKPNKDKLQDLINQVQYLDSSKYTSKTWKAMQKQLEKALKVIEDEDATEKDIAKAEANLKVAIEGLELVSAGGSNSGNGSANNGNNGNGGSSNSGNGSVSVNDSRKPSNEKLPNTGGTPAASVGVIGTIMAVIGTVMFKKKK